MDEITAVTSGNAALYQRVSTLDQSAARQAAANQAAAEQAGWRTTEYDQDSGQSASRFARGSRADYVQLLSDIAAGHVDILVISEVSRADRDTERWSSLLASCRRHGVKVHVTSKHRTYDPAVWEDRETLLRAGIAAEGESELLSDRIRDGKAYWRQQRGQEVSGRPLYGVHRVNDPDRSRNRWLRDEPDPQSAPVVARIVAHVAAGVPLAVIAASLTADGIPSSRGGAWHMTTVRQIAGRPEYVALGIVTQAASLAARARLARTAGKGRGKGERPARSYRYSGCLACAVCGASVRGATRAGVARYICSRGMCVSVPADQVDTWVDARAIDMLARPELFAPLFADADAGAAELARTEAAGHRQAIADAAASYAAGRLPLAALETITTALQARAEQAEQAARQAATPSALAGLPDDSRDVVAARWDALSVSARKAAMRAMAPRASLARGRRGSVRSHVSERVTMWPGS